MSLIKASRIQVASAYDFQTKKFCTWISQLQLHKVQRRWIDGEIQLQGGLFDEILMLDPVIWKLFAELASYLQDCVVFGEEAPMMPNAYFVGGNLISLASIPITLTPVLLVMMAQKFRHYSNFWEVYPTMPACLSLKTWKYVRLANNLVDAATAKIKFQEGCHPLLKSGNFWKKPRIKGRSGGWCFQSCCCKSFLTIHRRCYVCLLMKILGSRLQAKSSVVTNENCEIYKMSIIASFLNFAKNCPLFELTNECQFAKKNCKIVMKQSW